MTPRRAALLTSLVWVICLGSCATTTVKTWLITDSGLEHKTASIDEAITFVEAKGYRCYSPADDLTWRQGYSDYKTCCESK